MSQKENTCAILTLNDIHLTVDNKELISGGGFVVRESSRIGLVGRNGSGKSMLLSMIYNVLSGNENGVAMNGNKSKISFASGTTVGYMPQKINSSFTGTVQEYFAACNQGAPIGDTNHLDSMLNMLAINKCLLSQNIGRVSGGEATKIALVGAILSPRKLYLLDEPTNNLDIDGILFLDVLIATSPSAMIIVSHDRAVLNQMDTIVEIDEESATLQVYGGNYEFYHRQKNILYERRKRLYEEQQKKKARLIKSVDVLEERAGRMELESHSSFYRSRGAKVARQAKSQKKRINQELEQVSCPPQPQKPAFSTFDKQDHSPFLLFSLRKISYTYNNARSIFNNVSFDVHNGDRVALIGANGSGKSTLLRVIKRMLCPTQGEFVLSDRARIGYVHQSPENVYSDDIIGSYLHNACSLSIADIKKILGRLLINVSLHTRVGSLSVGEMRKIEIGCALAKNPNLLLLDEPTNHMDLYTIEMLEQTLLEYKGALVIVSHDRYLLSRLNIKRALIFRGQHIIERSLFDNNVSDINDLFREATDEG